MVFAPRLDKLVVILEPELSGGGGRSKFGLDGRVMLTSPAELCFTFKCVAMKVSTDTMSLIVILIIYVRRTLRAVAQRERRANLKFSSATGTSCDQIVA